MVSRRTSQGFVGRERELSAMTAALDAAVSGRGGIVLLGGEPGIGKTRTAEEVSAIAREQRVLPLWGRCHEGEIAPAFWPWVQVLRAYVADHNPDTFRTALGVQAPLLARLIPEIDGGDAAAAAPPADPKQEMFLLFDGITTFLRAAARPDPLLIVLDDLHWADAPSLGLLQYLAAELAGARILVVGAYRDAGLDRAHPLTATLAELARVPGTSRLPLRGLADREVAQLLEDTLGAPATPALVSAVQQQTEGNAFFVTEVARLLANQEHLSPGADAATALPIAVPPTVRDVIGRRLSGLSAACSGLLEVAAVFGRAFPVAALQQVFSRMEGAPPAGGPIAQDRDRMLTLLEEAERAGIIADLPNNRGFYQFSHILISGLLYEDLLSTRRSRLHRLVGEALESIFAADLTPHSAELAHHFAMAVPAGDPAKAIAYARQAGDAGVRLYSYAEAAGHYRRALELLDLPPGADPGSAPGPSPDEQRCDLLLSLGEAERLGGEMAEARQTFVQASAIARRLRSAERLARAALGVGPGLFAQGPLDTQLIELLEAALGALEEGDSPLRSMLQTELATALFYVDGHERSLALGQQALAMAERLGDVRAAAQAFRFQQMATARLPVAEHLVIYEKLQQLAQHTANPELMFQSLSARVVCMWEMGNGPRAADAIESYTQLADELRQPAYQVQSLIFRAGQATLTGRFAEAESLAHQVLRLGPRTGRRDPLLVFAGEIFLLRLLQGRFDEIVDSVRDFAEQNPAAPVWRCALGYLYAETGREADARAELDRVVASGFRDFPADTLWLFSLIVTAETAAIVDDAPRAAMLYDRLLPYAGQCAMLSGTIGCIGAVARVLGLLAACMHRWDDARRHFDAALQINESLDARPWLARTQHAYAAMLLGGGSVEDRDVALGLARQAHGTARALGMRRLSERAQQLLDHPAPSPPPSFPDGLTAREVEVLRLIARGRTTREIAGDLVVSDATVERHITNLYTKIGARNRADAAGYALRHGLT